MSSIITFTMNPALDISIAVERIEKRHKLRAGAALLDPGGGGVNVSRVMHRLGGESTALYAVGGPTGHAYRELLEAEGIRGHPIPIDAATRSDVTVDETSTGDQYRFVAQGPELSKLEWQSCLDVLAEHVEREAYLVASGSLPPGVPADSEIVALTLGADGAVFAWSGGMVRISTPKVETRSAVGAGDSFVGALVLQLAQNGESEEAFRYALAAGAAALMTPATELCRRNDVERLYRQMGEQA